MTYYYNATHSQTVEQMCGKLTALLTKLRIQTQPVILLCIGSDRSTGDSLGPLIGYKLLKFSFENVYVYGSLNHPIHAVNLCSYIDYIEQIYKEPFIIAMDASLGKEEHIGFITLGIGPLKPGLGVKKELPKVGNLHITGIVNSSSNVCDSTLQTTRLHTIMTMADAITDVFVHTFPTNTFPDKSQEPLTPCLPPPMP